MTQANKGDGWTLDISEARSGGTGPESNRDKARRGGWGTGEVLSVGFNVSLGGVPDPVSGAKPGGTVMVRSAPNALTKRHTVLMIDPAMFSDPAKGERFALEGLTLLLYVGRARFALTIGAGDTEKTICENARCLLAAAGLDQHVRIQWCEQEQSASDGGHLQHGREVADHAEMTRTFGASQDGDGPAHPDPAPGQVWLPPVGACQKGWLSPDGTLTLYDVKGKTVRFVDGACVDLDAMTATGSGWTCIGVATPNGRVMVGDGFVIDTSPEVTVVGVCSRDGHVRMSDGMAHPAGWLLAFGRRTRYAPARAGERYRAGGGYCAEPETVDATTAGRQFDATAWERLDPGQDGDGQTIKIKRPASVVEAERGRAGDAATAEPDFPRATGAALDAIASHLFGIERRDGMATAYRGGTERETDEALRARCVERLRLPTLDAASRDGHAFRTEPEPQPKTAALTLRAPARDLRALFDAIGRALESAAPEVVTFDGKPLSVLRSDACAEPSVHGGAIDANARDLCVLRASVAQALAVGRSCICQWGKGRTLTVERVGGPLVTAQPAPEPAATHYDGAQGGPDAWRWEVAE